MVICLNSFCIVLSTILPPQINPPTTSTISKTNYSPPSSGSHRSLFVKPAKRGKQRAGGEALFPSNHSSRSPNQRSILPPLPCMFAMISASLTRFWSPIIVFFNAEADRAKSRQCWSSSGHFSRAWMKAATKASPHPMGSTTG